MEHKNTKSSLQNILPAWTVFIILGSALIYAMLQISTLIARVDSLTLELATTSETLSHNKDQFSKKFTELDKQTAGLNDTLTNTKRHIDAVKNQVGGVAETVGSISGTVTNLQKLAQVDPQLLKKYSKVYFLSDNYSPAHVTTLPTEYTYSSARSEQFLSESWPFLKNLIDQAKVDGVPIYVKSGYRSFAEQKSLKSSYAVTYGAGTANAFSADQGYSEHQLGTTLDFITTGLGGSLVGFDTTAAYTWLTQNGYKYGFILSYPKGNKYYIYEPWHWRFVGVQLATYLHNSNLNFYDLEQRDIDRYLITTFDQ